MIWHINLQLSNEGLIMMLICQMFTKEIDFYFTLSKIKVIFH